MFVTISRTINRSVYDLLSSHISLAYLQLFISYIHKSESYRKLTQRYHVVYLNTKKKITTTKVSHFSETYYRTPFYEPERRVVGVALVLKVCASAKLLLLIARN
jgi:hypothetical protein